MWPDWPAAPSGARTIRRGDGPWWAWALRLSPKWGRSPYQVGPGRVVLELFGFGVVRVVVQLVARIAVPRAGGDVVAGDLRRIERGRAVLQRETQLVQLDLHLVDGLLAAVADIQQIGLRAGDELAHRVHALALEAVVRPHREVQVVDRQCERGDVIGLGRRWPDLDALGLDVEFACQTEQFDQRLARRRQRVTGGDRTLGLDVEDQLVEVGALLDTGRLHLVGDLEHRRVDGIDRDTANFGARRLVLHGGHVAAAALDDQLDLELALVVEGGDVHVGVVYRHAGGRDDVTRGDLAGALLAQVHGDRLVLLGRHDQTLEVQDDVGDVFLDTGDGGELVQHTVDANAGNRRAGNRRQQRAPKRIAKGVTESGLQRLDNELGPILGLDFFGQCGSLRNQHVFLPPSRHPLFDAEISDRHLDGAESLTSSRTRRSAARRAARRSAHVPVAGAPGCADAHRQPAATPGSDGRPRSHAPPRTAVCSATCP